MYTLLIYFFFLSSFNIKRNVTRRPFREGERLRIKEEERPHLYRELKKIEYVSFRIEEIQRLSGKYGILKNRSMLAEPDRLEYFRPLEKEGGGRVSRLLF